GRRWLWPAGLTFLLLYTGYCCFSVATATPKIMGVWELSKIFRGVLVVLAAAAFVRTRRELSILVLALGCAVGVQAIHGLKQRYLSGMYRVSGTLDHENSLSMYLCTVTPVLLAAALSNWSRPLRWFAGLACVFGAMTEMLT